MHAKPFVFMRHGRTQANAEHLICGRTDVPLSAQGQAQARAAQALLQPHAWSCVVVSTALRARQTAALAVPGVPQWALAQLCERDWGALEGLPVSQLCAYTDTPPDGEPWADFVARIAQGMAQVLTQVERPLIVAHSGVWRALRYAWTGSPQGERLANAQPMWVHPPQADRGWHWGALPPAASLPWPAVPPCMPADSAKPAIPLHHSMQLAK